jgi:hypothetical protein
MEINTMCPAPPIRRSRLGASHSMSLALALALRVVLIACALLLARAELHFTQARPAARDAARPWAEQVAPRAQATLFTPS